MPEGKQRAADIAALDLNLLKIFEALMHERNLGRAAARLGKSATATSQALGRLRSFVGDPLFETSGRGMVPTQRALEMAPVVRTVLDQLNRSLRRESGFEPKTARRSFTIDIPVGGDFIIAPALLGYAARHAPDVTFVVVSDRSESLRQELRYGETALAVDYGPINGDGMRHELLYEDPFYVMSRRNHPVLSRGQDVTIEQLRRVDHVGLAWSRLRGDSPMQSRLTEVGLDRRFRILVPTLGAIPAVVEATDLVATMSERVVRHCSRRWALDMHPLGFRVQPLALYLVWHERFDGDPGHAWLRQAVREAASAF